MKVRIEIRVDDPKTILTILKSDIKEGAYFSRDSGVSVKAVPQSSRHAFPGNEVLVCILEFSTGVSAGLIANWIYDRLKNKGATIIIGKEEILIENAEKLGEIIIEAAIQDDTEK